MWLKGEGLAVGQENSLSRERSQPFAFTSKGECSTASNQNPMPQTVMNPPLAQSGTHTLIYVHQHSEVTAL